MRDPSEKERFLGAIDVVDADWLAAVAVGFAIKAGLEGERAHQPRLAAAEAPDMLGSTALNHLAALHGVLNQQLPCLASGEVTEAL